MGLPYIEDFFEGSSNGRVDFEFVPLHQWLRAENNFESYLGTTAIGGYAIGREINTEATRLADHHIDFTNYAAIMVVLPSSRFGDGISSGIAPHKRRHRLQHGTDQLQSAGAAKGAAPLGARWSA